MNLSDCTHVFYVPGSSGVIDCAWQPEGKDWQTVIYGTPLSEVQQKHPSVQVLSWDEVIPLIQKASIEQNCSSPIVIDEERFMEMLNVLPPVRWRSGGDSESFMISEALILNIRNIFCRIGNTYFEMSDVDTLSHQEIVDKCRSVLVVE